MTAKVTLKDVGRVAELANLELTSEESASMLVDLNAILDYVAELDELDTANVAPLASVNELDSSATANVLRADEPIPCLDRATVMRESPETDGTFFKVPKVIER
jgi:aspartyl-tRNA(Asn)/glutamyl-tRNA(Gln) amidotransferase subunit C